MVELTIEISDELAQRLKPLQHQLPQLLGKLLETTSFAIAPQPETTKTPSPDVPTVYQEVLDFLIARPTPAEIVAFKVSPHSQERLQVLLEKNHQGTLTASETAEMDVFEQLDYLMMLLKARACSAVN